MFEQEEKMPHKIKVENGHGIKDEVRNNKYEDVNMLN